MSCELCLDPDQGNTVYDAKSAEPYRVCYTCWQMSEDHKKIFEWVARIARTRREIIRKEVREILFVDMENEKSKGLEP